MQHKFGKYVMFHKTASVSYAFDARGKRRKV